MVHADYAECIAYTKRSGVVDFMGGLSRDFVYAVQVTQITGVVRSFCESRRAGAG